MGKALPWLAIGLGTLLSVGAIVDLFEYRKFRQHYVNAGWLPGTKTKQVDTGGTG